MLWWAPYEPVGVDLDGIGAPPSPPPPRAPRILALEPRGGPTAGGTVLSIHGLRLGAMRRLRYAPEGAWLPPTDHGTKMAVLPICHADCPQTADAVRELREPWRHDLTSLPQGSPTLCDSDAPQPMAGDATLDDAAWYRFVAPTGDSKSSALLGAAPAARACGTDAPGWLASAHPVAGDPPAEGKVCFVYGSSDCFWQKTVHMCACSFDGGATAVYTYKLPAPTDSGCLAYCSAGDAAPEAAEAAAAAALDARIGRLAAAGDDTYALMLNSSRDRPFRTPMPGAAAHSGAHVDTVTESTMVVRTPSLPAQRAQLQVSAAFDAMPLGLRWHGNESDAFSGDAAHQQGGVGFLPLRQVEQFNQGEARERLEQHWGEPERVYMAALYTYYEEPDVDKIWPASGPAAGGTNVSVVGRRFDVLHGLHGVACRFGTTVVAAHHKNDTHVLCASPPGLPSGAHSFALTLNGHDFTAGGPAAAAFTVYRASLAAIEPTCGALQGGTLVTLRGAGFDGAGGMGYDASGAAVDPRCRFGGVWAVVHEMSATHAVCRLPSGGADAEVHGAQVDGADAMPYGDGAQRPRAGAVRVELALERRRLRGRGAVHVLRRAVDSVGDADGRAAQWRHRRPRRRRRLRPLRPERHVHRAVGRECHRVLAVLAHDRRAGGGDGAARR